MQPPLCADHFVDQVPINKQLPPGANFNRLLPVRLSRGQQQSNEDCNSHSYLSKEDRSIPESYRIATQSATLNRPMLAAACHHNH
jgi:hypothetical protein